MELPLTGNLLSSISGRLLRSCRAAGAAAPVSVSEAALGESIPAAAEGAPAATGGWDAPALAAPVETMWGDLSVEAAFHAASQPAYWEPVGGAPKASVQPQESSAEGLSGPEAQQVQAQSNWVRSGLPSHVPVTQGQNKIMHSSCKCTREGSLCWMGCAASGNLHDGIIKQFGPKGHSCFFMC